MKTEWAQRITLGDLITFGGSLLMAAGFAWNTRAEVQVVAKRVDEIEARRLEDIRLRERDDARIEASLRDIREAVRRVEDKLDRKADK